MRQRFHAIINSKRGNQEALHVLERNSRLIANLRRSFAYTPERMRTILVEHNAIIEGLEAHSPEKAAAAAAYHVRSAAADLINRFSQSRTKNDD